MDPNILGNKGDLHIPGPQLSTSVFQHHLQEQLTRPDYNTTLWQATYKPVHLKHQDQSFAPNN